MELLFLKNNNNIGNNSIFEMISAFMETQPQLISLLFYSFIYVI